MPGRGRTANPDQFTKNGESLDSRRGPENGYARAESRLDGDAWVAERASELLSAGTAGHERQDGTASSADVEALRVAVGCRGAMDSPSQVSEGKPVTV